MEHQSGKHHENCLEILEELSAYLDAELPPDACGEIEEHLSGCPPCIEFVNSLRRTVELCREFKPDALPAPLGEEARRRLLAAYRNMIASRKGSPASP